MTASAPLNQFLKALNQNRSLRPRFYPAEKNRVFRSVKCGLACRFGRNLNQFVNGFRASARGVMMMTDRA